MIYAQRDRLVSERTLGQQYLFILRTLTKQARFQKKKLYTCFVDLKKAFDTVPRDLLWQVLEGLGISGRILECLRSMCHQEQACLHHPEEGLTPTFLCRIGVKQGCPLSPLLFGLFIDGLEKRLNALEGDAPPMLGPLAFVCRRLSSHVTHSYWIAEATGCLASFLL